MIKKYILWIGLIGLIIGFWVSFPEILLRSINNVDSRFIAEKAEIINTDCVRLTNVDVSAYNSKVSGNFPVVIACRDGKVNIDGGTISGVFNNDKNSSGLISSASKKYLKYNINAKNLDIGISFNDYSVTLKNATYSNNLLCSRFVYLEDYYTNITTDNFCIDVLTKEFSFSGGIVEVNVQNEFFKEILFGSGAGNRESVRTTYISSPTINAEGVSVSKNIITANRVEINDKRVFSRPVTISDVETSSIFDNDIFISSMGVGFHIGIDQKRVWGNNSCQDWLDIIPAEMKNNQISLVKTTGNLFFDVSIGNSVWFDLRHSCDLKEVPVFINQLKNVFTYQVYHLNKTRYNRVTGPATKDWISYNELSPYLINAVTTTEDPGFFVHRGIIAQAFENSLKDNVKLGKFFRGGSTISMQLAKNLWLSRERSIGRKIQEGILTVALEKSLSKEQILELYFNVVEFGPNIYGIRNGAKEIFNKGADELNLEESIYMVLRLPAPNRSASFEKSKGKIQQIRDLMVSKGKIAEEEI